jgi:hypothetical protein
MVLMILHQIQNVMNGYNLMQVLNDYKQVNLKYRRSKLKEDIEI